MGSGLSTPVRIRLGWLAAIVVPLVLLVGAPASAWHGEHADERECAVCHAGHQSADLARPAGIVSSHAPARIDAVRAVSRAVALRQIRRPARAPPA